MQRKESANHAEERANRRVVAASPLREHAPKHVSCSAHDEQGWPYDSGGNNGDDARQRLLNQR